MVFGYDVVHFFLHNIPCLKNWHLVLRTYVHNGFVIAYPHRSSVFSYTMYRRSDKCASFFST